MENWISPYLDMLIAIVNNWQLTMFIVYVC